MFVSDVTMISNPFCSARASRRPFETPAHPISGAVLTSNAVRRYFSPAGTLSSSRSRRMRSPGELNDPARRLDGKAGIDVGDDLLRRIAVLGVVDHALSRNASAAHNRRAGHHVGLALDIRALRPVYPHNLNPSTIGVRFRLSMQPLRRCSHYVDAAITMQGPNPERYRTQLCAEL